MGIIRACLFTVLLVNTVLAEFSYDGDTGPPYWPCTYPDCGGNQQSPIALNKVISEPVSLRGFDFQNYDMLPSSASLYNSGHSVEVSINLSSAAVVSNGDLPGNFEFAQFHFHWGSELSRGSEHIMDGIQYPMEMHLVHFNQKYGTVAEAKLHPDGLAVLGVLFRHSMYDYQVLDPIVQAIADVPVEGDTVAFDFPYTLFDVLPRDLNNYYRYDGSLTTPGCNEAVTWTVFTQLSDLVSDAQLNVFRSLTAPDGLPLVDNFRPIQPIKDRVLYLNGN